MCLHAKWQIAQTLMRRRVLRRLSRTYVIWKCSHFWRICINAQTTSPQLRTLIFRQATPLIGLRNHRWAATCDHFQQCGILTSVDSEPVRPKKTSWWSVSSLTVIEYPATSNGSDQAARMRRLAWAFVFCLFCYFTPQVNSYGPGGTAS